ncbi:MAG: endopeptidase La [Spirochaetales bacterium]|nr:endopeptidase La [Spirochaetales bacterium]
MNGKEILPSDQILPHKLLIIPLYGKPIFPGIFTPVMLGSDADVSLVERSLSSDGFLGLLLTKKDDMENPQASDLFSIGTVAKIVKKINLPDGGVNIFISTLKRFKVKKVLHNDYPVTVAVDYLDDTNHKSTDVKAYTRSLLSEMKQISENNPLFSEEMRLNMVNIDHPGKIADFITSILNIDRYEQQHVLEMTDVRKRMEHVLVFIKKEQELLRIQKKIQNQINDKITKSQREYFLKEELKAIKHELGMDVDAKSSEYRRIKAKIEEIGFSADVKEQIDNEVEKLGLMDPNSSEFVVTRNYLDTIVSLPWTAVPAADIDLKKAHAILEADHYGLEEVKERILEYLSVRKIKQDTKGSIICLVGPPGVGKTSVGKSIARALDKKFFRFSVGGMRDEAEIKGHRRTYVGAMPGKIIQGLKYVKAKDPVFMIDEIDKLGASYQGDPSSALLEVLDPEQNIAFRDHYLDIPFDISNVFFITTANTLDTIPRPLLDRMELIRLSGYINAEKLHIARKYLVPKSLDRHGLKKSQVKYSQKTLLAIPELYSREAGMRNYEKALDRIHRKIARRSVIEEIKFPVEISPEDLETYLGQPKFREEDTLAIDRPGMITGLAWTEMGGATLTIEAIANPGKEGFKLTGQMGEVMQESANIACSYIRHIGADHKIPLEFFEKNQIHLHIPAGATPKDGPSAGITMASALLSLATNRIIKKPIAMTGELSLVGHVLPIGGLKEKVIAARRHKIKEIIIPEANNKDLEEIPENVKSGITFYPVKTMEQVVAILFAKKKVAGPKKPKKR